MGFRVCCGWSQLCGPQEKWIGDWSQESGTVWKLLGILCYWSIGGMLEKESRCYLHCWLSNLRCCPCRLQLPALLSRSLQRSVLPVRQLNHAVLLVGYNKSGSQHYWIVKNSWGSGWGTSGYIHMKMGENSCGIANMAMYPLC